MLALLSQPGLDNNISNSDQIFFGQLIAYQSRI